VAAPASVHPPGPAARRAPTTGLEPLLTFRAGLHGCFARPADALLELGDALLCAPAVPSVAQLSLEPAHRRGWGSAYDALASGRIDTERLRDLLVGSLPPADPLVFAVDVTTWPRCDAECSPARGYYYHPSRHSAGQPIVAGWAYQWVCQLSFARGLLDRPGRRGQAASPGRHRPASRPPGPRAA
jgi:DDE superfamily endonuclease